MTCYFDPDTWDVYDHTGAKVGNVLADTDSDGSYSDDYPQEVFDVLRQNMEGNQPSAYNQALIADMASNNIEIGTPDS